MQFFSTTALMWGHVIPTLASPTAKTLPSDTLISLLSVPLLAKLLQPALLHFDSTTPLPAQRSATAPPAQPHHATGKTRAAGFGSSNAMQHLRSGSDRNTPPSFDGGLGRQHAELCAAVLQHAVVVTASGSKIQLMQSDSSMTEAEQKVKRSDCTNVYLPTSLGGAADWDTEFPEACFEVLCAGYSRRFPHLQDQWRCVRRQGRGAKRA